MILCVFSLMFGYWNAQENNANVISNELNTITVSKSGTLFLLPHSCTAFPERITAAFAGHCSAGLLHLGLSELETDLPLDLAYWWDFSKLYFSKLCMVPGISECDGMQPIDLPAPREELAALVQSAPPMGGGEYLNERVLASLWEKVHQTF